MNRVTRCFVSKLYFHISQHVAHEFLYSVTYKVGIKPIMNRFDTKLNPHDIFKRRFLISDFTELQ
jgi:hypothetical protein